MTIKSCEENRFRKNVPFKNEYFVALGGFKIFKQQQRKSALAAVI